MRTSLTTTALAAIAALSLLSFAISAQAAVIGASSGVLHEGEPGVASGVIYGPSGSISSAGYTSLLGGSAADGFGQAGYGILHASGSAIATGNSGGLTVQMRGLGGAYWLDQVTISSSTLTGTAFVTASFSLSGGLASLSGATAVGAIGNSSVAARVRVNGSNAFQADGQLISRNGAITTNTASVEYALNGTYFDLGAPLTGTFTFDFPITLGTAFQLFVTLDTFTQALAFTTGDVASAYSNFGSTAYWGGISSVRLADGTLVDDFGLGSDSGFNYRNAFLTAPPQPPVNGGGNPAAVPEPITLSLLGAGLAGIGVMRRKRKQATSN